MTSLSSFSISLEESRTSKTKSDFSISCFDFFTPIFSTISSVSLIPAVSTRIRGIPFILITSSIISLVVPGTWVTIALSSFKREFNKVDYSYHCNLCEFDMCCDCFNKVNGKSPNLACHQHPLAISDNDNYDWICDFCDREGANGDSWSCKACDFDVCLNCYWK